MATVDEQILTKASTWLSEDYDKDTRAQVQHLIQNNHQELTDAFYKDLEFGTGGLRGIMGAGTNRINIYTVSMATQGLCNYLLQSFPNEQIKVAIAHDSRNNGRLFSETAASIFSANGIQVYLFKELRPTPILSYAVRELGCHSGIVLTASHNPKEYNGYKVYWQDGGQLVPPHDKNVIDEVRNITSITDVKKETNDSLITEIGKEIDEKYLQKVKELSLMQGDSDLKIVYTSLHGTGITLIPDSLKKVGFQNVVLNEEQAQPDGNFPTVVSPNPEEREALTLAIEQAREIGADLVLGTDPDTDRVGAVCKNKEGEYVILNGNQTGALLVYYLLTQWKAQGKLTGKEFTAKTIVTTELIREISDSFNVECIDTLTGFKYIAELIKNLEGEKQFIGGGEESYGYLAGDFVRDKDAVISSVLICEVADWAKKQGKTLLELLDEIHQQFGYYQEHLVSVTKKGKAGAEEIQQMMARYRNNPPNSLANIAVQKLVDYKEEGTGFPKSNVIQFFLEDGSKVTARPSGTEPKIKFYISVKSEVEDGKKPAQYEKELKEKIDNILQSLGV